MGTKYIAVHVKAPAVVTKGESSLNLLPVIVDIAKKRQPDSTIKHEKIELLLSVELPCEINITTPINPTAMPSTLLILIFSSLVKKWAMVAVIIGKEAIMIAI